MVVTKYTRKMEQIQVKPCNTSVDAQSETFKKKRYYRQSYILEVMDAPELLELHT